MRLGACIAGLVAHRHQVFHGAAYDAAELLLLVGVGVDVDRDMADHAVGAVLDLCRIERPAHEAAMPMHRRHRAEARPLAEGRGRSDAGEAHSEHTGHNPGGSAAAIGRHDGAGGGGIGVLGIDRLLSLDISASN